MAISVANDPMYGPAGVAREFDELGGERSCINVSGLEEQRAPGHHGYQRACDLLSGKILTGHLGHQCSHAPGRPYFHLVSFSRRPRQVSVKQLAHH